MSSLDSTNKSIHFAIVSDDDEYMGTVSLKNIQDKKAEFGIAIRKSAMGNGYSKYGMEEAIRYGFEKKGLNQIYWCVSPENERAVKFYDKNGYRRVPSNVMDDSIIREEYSDKEVEQFIWYLVENKQ